jgi:periplasmic protein TonB
MMGMEPTDMPYFTGLISLQSPQRGRWLPAIALCFFVGLAVAPMARAVTEGAVPLRTSAPTYPYDLKRDGITGVVTVVFSVDENGNVVEPAIQKSTNSGFDQAALNAISKWKFRPARQDGVPVRSKVAIPLQFTISKD